MQDIDFWNLAGRAGRLTKDLSGNVFGLRILDVEGYWKKDSEVDIIKNKNISIVKTPLMEKNDGNLYINISNALNNRPFTRAYTPVDEKGTYIPIAIYYFIMIWLKVILSYGTAFWKKIRMVKTR